MFKKKYFFVLLLLIVAVGTIAGVSASDANQTDIIADSEDTTGEIIALSDDDANELSTQSEVPNVVAVSNNQNSGLLTDDDDFDDDFDDYWDDDWDDEDSYATIKTSKITTYYKNAKKGTVKVLDGYNSPASGVTVKIKIFSGSSYKTITAKTNSKGIATYNVPTNLAAGNHKVIVSISSSYYSASNVVSYITVKPRPISYLAQLFSANGVIGFNSLVKDNLLKKYTNGIKLKVMIYNSGKWITRYLTSGYDKSSRLSGVIIYATNMLTVGSHLVKIMPATKNYYGNKLTKLVVTKNAKIYYKKWAIWHSGGKIYTVINGRTYVQ